MGTNNRKKQNIEEELALSFFVCYLKKESNKKVKIRKKAK